MYRLEVFENPIEAQMAAAYLRRQGILACVVGSSLDMASSLAGLTMPAGGTVAIALERQRKKALDLLDHFKHDTVEMDEDWELDAEPDLSRLDPTLPLHCPDCGTSLRTGNSIAPKCPSCFVEHELAELVVTQHGPEALESCYIQTHANDWLTDEFIEGVGLDCGRCGYELDGLARTGACPECGVRYDKREIIGRLFGQAGPDVL